MHRKIIIYLQRTFRKWDGSGWVVLIESGDEGCQAVDIILLNVISVELVLSETRDKVEIES